MKTFQEFITEGIHDPAIFKVFFIAGGPGSGKSFITKKVTPASGMKIVNSDTLFELLMKKAKMSLNLLDLTPSQIKKKDEIRNKAKEITSKQLTNFIDGRLGVVIDGTGRDYNKIKNQRQQFIDMGYDAYIIFINTTLDVALERNKLRTRKVPEDFVQKAWNDVQNNMGKFQSLFNAKNFILIDNTEVKEIPDRVLNKAWKKINLLVKKPIKNPIAKTWIQAELDKKKNKQF